MKSIDISCVPMYRDGSSGSMWTVHPTMAWMQVLGNPDKERNHFITVSDFIKLLADAGIEVTYGKPEPKKTQS